MTAAGHAPLLAETVECGRILGQVAPADERAPVAVAVQQQGTFESGAAHGVNEDDRRMRRSVIAAPDRRKAVEAGSFVPEAGINAIS